MQAAAVTVGETPVAVPLAGKVNPAARHADGVSLGMRLLARADNSGDVYLGTTADVTTSTGVLLPKGDPGTTLPYFVPPEHFAAGGAVYLVGSDSGQVVDWSAQYRRPRTAVSRSPLWTPGHAE